MTSEQALPMHLRLKRAYEAATSDDGMRILVDRLWPRGLTKSSAAIDRWLREIAPTTVLRQWFGHNPERWAEFRRRYTQELRQQAVVLDEIRQLAKEGPVTLVYSAHDQEHNQAVVLREILLKTKKSGQARLDRTRAA